MGTVRRQYEPLLTCSVQVNEEIHMVPKFTADKSIYRATLLVSSWRLLPCTCLDTLQKHHCTRQGDSIAGVGEPLELTRIEA
jgi:hypothetical protein